MPTIICPTCQTWVPQANYKQHRQRHSRGPKPNGRYGSTRQWRRTRERVLARDGYVCQHPTCSLSTYLEIHHLDGDYTNNDESNLITYCKWHHPR